MKTGLPKDWKLVKLGEVCKLKNGFAFKSSDYMNNGIPVIRISDINDGIVSTDNSVRVCENENYEDYVVLKDEILVAMSGATTGKFGIFKGNEKAYQNQRVGKFQILNRDLLNNNFLFYQINSLKRKIEKDAYGGAQPNISSGKIEEMDISLPPLPEQHRIVEKLEELLSELEKGKEQLHTALDQLKVYRQAVLKYAFEGKLTNNAKVKSKNSKVENGELPKGWKWVKVKEIADSIQYGYTESSSKETVGPKFLRITDIQDNSVNWKEVPYCKISSDIKHKYLLNDGDLVFARTGATVGKSFLIKGQIPEAIFASYLIRLRFNKTVLDKYVWSYFQSLHYWRQITDGQVGIGQPNVNGTKLGQLIFPLCSFEEQHRIVEEIESRLSVADKLEETITASLQQSETLRQSILKKAFEGRLV